MCCTYLIIWWSNTKRFLSVLNVFGKCFCFEKSQKFQKLCNFSSWVKLVASLLRSFRDSLASQAPSREKDLEKFQNFGFLGFSQFSLATGSRVEAPVASFTQNVLRLPLWLTCEWTFQSQKTLRQIFQILSHGFLVTWICDLLQLILVTKNVCFTLWGLFLG